MKEINLKIRIDELTGRLGFATTHPEDSIENLLELLGALDLIKRNLLDKLEFKQRTEYN